VPDDLAASVRAARRAYMEAGNSVTERCGARFVLNRMCPQVWDANHVGGIGETGPVDPRGLLVAIEEEFAWAAHRQVLVGPAAPESLAALLTVEGYELRSEVDLVLPAGRDVPAGREVGGLAIRPVRSREDEAALVALTRADHLEAAAAQGREPWSDDVTLQMVTVRLAKAPAVQFFLASVEGADVAFFSSFATPGPGARAVGIVEDLFTLRHHRGRGIARALIRYCVADARARGAREVSIGAEPSDWPRRWYAALGFDPTLLRLAFHRSIAASGRSGPSSQISR
jgi:GNAT superfamily N-acetyltransferase